MCAPLNPEYREREFEFFLTDLQPKAILLLAGRATPSRPAAERLGVRILEIETEATGPAGTFRLVGGTSAADGKVERASEDDVALILHTSGTTSRPKMVPLTHGNLCASAENVKQALALTPTDRCLNVMPLFHIHGLVAAVLASLSAGGCVICTPGFYAPDFFDWVREGRPTWYTAVPTMHQAILARAAENQAVIRANPLRLIRSSSASLPPQVMEALENDLRRARGGGLWHDRGRPPVGEQSIGAPSAETGVGWTGCRPRGRHHGRRRQAVACRPTRRGGHPGRQRHPRLPEQCPRRTPRRLYADGFEPGIKATWMRMDTCSSPAGSRRSSTAGARRSLQGRSTRSSWIILLWPRR